jgi:glycerol-3-phosphate dehydrogenase
VYAPWWPLPLLGHLTYYALYAHRALISLSRSHARRQIIEPSVEASNFIHAAGIDSPGLAGSPAIALDVVRLLEEAGLELEADAHFNPVRAPLITPKDGWRGIRCGPPGKVTEPECNVVCKCEKVTEAEVLECLRRSLPVDNTQAVRKRVRAGMGHCQADPNNYGCEQRVAEILARELGYANPGAIGRRNWPATSTLPQRWPTEQQKSELHQLGKAAAE